MCLAQGDNAVWRMRLKPQTPQYQVKHSSTELLHSHNSRLRDEDIFTSKKKKSTEKKEEMPNPTPNTQKGYLHLCPCMNFL